MAGTVTGRTLGEIQGTFKFYLKVLMDAEGAKKRNYYCFSNAQAKGQGQKISVNITYSIY